MAGHNFINIKIANPSRYIIVYDKHTKKKDEKNLKNGHQVIKVNWRVKRLQFCDNKTIQNDFN